RGGLLHNPEVPPVPERSHVASTHAAERTAKLRGVHPGAIDGELILEVGPGRIYPRATETVVLTRRAPVLGALRVGDCLRRRVALEADTDRAVYVRHRVVGHHAHSRLM